MLGQRCTCDFEIDMSSSRRPRIYLAGPEVFLPEARAVAAEKRRLAAGAGCEGIFPLDGALDLTGLGKVEQARRIATANEALMRSCDGLIANLTPFRGVSMDAGTAFEVGFMRALGRPAAGYTNVARDYFARAQAFRKAGGIAYDADRPDVEIENFGLAENLMIEIAIRQSGGVVVRTPVPAGSEMTDLEGFRHCVGQLAAVLLPR
ncbi:MAG: nucleoside 2-deoxyribosyltransferase [Hyphomicrobiaceae bacterium]|nr:MAG: nucleoside 2-deoxyribosyltransferase [Hyphomicrobiaceae bacterium]